MNRLLMIASLWMTLLPARMWADESAAPQAVPTTVPAGAAGPTARPGGPAGPGAMPPGAKPASGSPNPAAGKPGEEKAGEKKEGEKKEGEAEVVRRQSLGEPQGNLEELRDAVLGPDGRVAFQFRNQGWPELIDWLAQLSGQPLDWQELPADRVNITTPGRYTVEEVVDLLNRHLLGRGYTLLALDGGMTVVKCATLNPALVPRVAPEDLDSISPHSFVRTSLDVGWLSAEKLAEELKPMISENGKLTALTTTNRIEAIDAAITLRQVAQLLAQEQDAASRESLVPEFRLRHIPADEAKRLLEQFLGISKKPEPVLTPQQIQQQQQMQQMRAQQGGKGAEPEPEKPAISVVANTRQNSILIQAPPDRVTIATEFLKRIDVPGSSMTSLSDVQSRVNVFRLVSLDPEKLIEIVQDMNVLEPTTRISVDAANRALIVSGSAADRFIIEQLITRLDGSGRRLEVLQLRRLEAADVAESISFLMGKNEDKEENSRSRYPSYYFGGSSEPEKKKEDEFRVAANTRFRQVLLWASEAEMKEVRSLLVKLGELPPPGGNDRTLRVIDAAATPETYQYLRALQQQWRSVAPNPLLLPPAEAFKTQPQRSATNNDEAIPADDEDPAAAEESSDGNRSRSPQAVPAADASATELPLVQHKSSISGRAAASPSLPMRLAAMQQPVAPLAEDASGSDEAATDSSGETATDPSGEIRSVEDFDRAFLSPATQRPPARSSDAAATRPSEPGSGERTEPEAEAIQIQWDAAGNLVLLSADTAALDRLEDLMLQHAPPKRPYHVFTTRYASAVWVKLNLEEYFEQEDEEQDDNNSFSRWYFGFDNSKESTTPEGLGRPAKLRFIADIETGSIVVSNASAEQLRSIEELIELWDVPEPANKRKVRYTRLVDLRYGKAAAIAETIKETYRDLLSSNDKAFQQGQGRQDSRDGTPQKNDSPRGRELNNGGSELVDTGGGQKGGGADFSFKGKLSLGIDELGNTLLVSAEGEPLLEMVCDMIDQLDRACRVSDGVQVINLSNTIDPAALEMALRTLQSSTQNNGASNAGPRNAALPNANRAAQGSSTNGPRSSGATAESGQASGADGPDG